MTRIKEVSLVRDNSIHQDGEGRHKVRSQLAAAMWYNPTEGIISQSCFHRFESEAIGVRNRGDTAFPSAKEMRREMEVRKPTGHTEYLSNSQAQEILAQGGSWCVRGSLGLPVVMVAQ